MHLNVRKLLGKGGWSLVHPLVKEVRNIIRLSNSFQLFFQGKFATIQKILALNYIECHIIFMFK